LIYSLIGSIERFYHHLTKIPYSLNVKGYIINRKIDVTAEIHINYLGEV